MRMQGRRRILPGLLVALASLLLVACGGAGPPDEEASEGEGGRAVAAPSDVEAEEREAGPALEAPVAGPASAEDASYDPDAAGLSRLVYWDAQVFPHSGDPPPAVLALFAELLSSGHPGGDKYLIDLGAYPSPYQSRVLEYLQDRFGGRAYTSVYDFPELFQFSSTDAETDAYVTFKRALFGALVPAFSLFLHQDLPRLVDAREVVWGGVLVDGIPPLEFPAYQTAEAAAAWLQETDEVVGVSINGDVRALPIRIIAWHEMVNDTIGGVPVSLAYCTLCGSAILYDGRLGTELYRFGTSGLLYRSNKLMYDRNTGTLWDQFTGEPVWGRLVGTELRLDSLPVTIMTWGAWRAAHPESMVLDIETGFERDYGSGVAYAAYNDDPGLWFNAPLADDRLAQKDEVYVVRVEGALTAYPIALLAERGVIADIVGSVPLVVVATADGRGGRAYASEEVAFRDAEPARGVLTDEMGRTWAVTEGALAAAGETPLARLDGHNAFWFAVVNHSPEGQLYEG